LLLGTLRQTDRTYRFAVREALFSLS
jgi:hypothetical protein